MRILIAGRGFGSPRGVTLGLFEEDQARALLEAGHDVRYAAVDTRSLRRLRPLGGRQMTAGNLPVFYAAFPASGLPGRLRRRVAYAAAERAWSLVTADGWKPQVIHGHFEAPFGPLAERNVIPFVYTEHFSGMNRPELPPKVEEEAAERYSRVTKLLCVSTALRDNLRRNSGVEALVVPNIVDTEVFCPFPVRHEGFRFVSACRLQPEKGIAELLTAMSRMKTCVELTVFGDGPERTRLEGLSAELSLTGRVSFRGSVSRETLAAEYRSADCFILPSRSETFGLAYGEALASGLPVIATRCGGPEDFIRPEDGLLVPVGDVPALAAAMDEMVRRRGEYDSETIACHARERFSPSAVAGQLTEIYRTLI